MTERPTPRRLTKDGIGDISIVRRRVVNDRLTAPNHLYRHLSSRKGNLEGRDTGGGAKGAR